MTYEEITRILGELVNEMKDALSDANKRRYFPRIAWKTKQFLAEHLGIEQKE